MSKKKKTILSIITMFVILLGIFLTFVFYRGSPDKILSVADQFKPPTSWKLESNDVTPPQTICLGDVACPSVSRSWKTEEVSQTELNSILRKTRWGMRIDEDCKFPSDASGTSIILCSTNGTLDNFDISVYVIANSKNPTHPKLVLNIRQH